MDYSELVEIYSKLEKTTKRLEMTKIIADFLVTVPDEELPTSYYRYKFKKRSNGFYRVFDR